MKYAAFLILAGCCSSPLVEPVDQQRDGEMQPAAPVLTLPSTDSTILTGGEPSTPAPSLPTPQDVKPPVTSPCKPGFTCDGKECRPVPQSDLRQRLDPMVFSELEAVPTGVFPVAPVTTTRGSLTARCSTADFYRPLSNGLIVVLTVLAFAGLVLFQRRRIHVS